jgi:hypothetical protein
MPEHLLGSCRANPIQGATMPESEHRKHPRYDALNLLNYVCLGAEGGIEQQGMGRTLNVSESGIQLEVHASLAVKTVVSLSIGLKENMIQIKGRVVHAKATRDGRHQAGIEFFDIDATELNVLKAYIKAFEKNQAQTQKE